MRGTSTNVRTKRELIIAAWHHLDRSTVGESELRQIQESLRVQFGEGAIESPATIARVLADEGAELRHPEVIEFDARWREAEIKSNAGRFGSFASQLRGKPLRLKQAEVFIKRLERLRERSARSGDKATLQSARDRAVEARQAAESLAANRTLDQARRAEQAEIAEWLAVWLQTPNLFAEWLELRRRSAEFRGKFWAEGSLPQRHGDTER